jgi:PAS domain S-box-containing protein
MQETHDCSGNTIESQKPEGTVFSRLGQNLNKATTVRRAAEVILEAADALLGWDAASLDLYSPELDRTCHVLNLDTVNGQQVECAPVGHDAPPSPRARRAIESGGQLFLKDEPVCMSPDAKPFGDTAHPSASIILVPVRDGSKITGLLSIQSYTPKAYDQQSLETLQSLADYCGGALDRIRTQEALRQEQALMLALMEHLPARVYFKDTASRFLRVSPALAKLFGFSDPAQLVGKSDADFFSAEHAGQALADEQKIIRTGQPLLDIEEKETWPDGSESWVLTSKSPLRDSAGRIIGTCGVSSDITERKQTELSALALSKLSQGLILATTQDEAARLLLQVADELFGWDACAFYLYSPETDLIHPVLFMDTIEGQRVEVPPPNQDGKPSPCNRRIIEQGADLTLKERSSPAMEPASLPFGDKTRPSAAIMRVPIRLRTNKVTGIVAIHSYTPQAYTRKDLNTLQTLADCFGVALERIWADEALRESETRFRTLVRNIPQKIFLKDRTFRWVSVNENFAREFGLRPEQVVGKTDYDFFPKELADKYRADDERIIRTGQTEEMEEKHLQDDRASWVQVIKTPVRDERGEIIGVFGVFWDITERKRADEALRQSESQFRLVWESTGDGLRLTDREGIILRVNDAYCRMVQKSRTELEGQVLTVAHSEANADFVLSTYQNRVDSNTLAPHLETEVTLWNGVKAWFELSNSLLEVPGKPPLVLSIFRDITSRKQTEADLARMHQQLLEVSRQAGMAEVATNVLHNVGNVLNSVNVSSSVISDMLRVSKSGNLAKAVALLQAHENDLAGFLTNDPKGRQLPGYLKSLAEHLAREQEETLKEVKALIGYIDHIKEIITMQQSYARVLGVVESLPVVDLVEDALRLNAGAMERHQVKVIREYFEVPPILVDKHKVLQILVNLIRNAKYALDDRGHSDKRLVLQVGLNGNNTVKISVIDNGIGIPPENLTRIFEHGFTTRKEGHGFGLHNGALAAKELGGKLTAQSDGPGQGATFTLELPRQPRDKGHGTELRAKRERQA